MLIQFANNNYKSINEPIALNLTPSTNVRRFKHHVNSLVGDSISTLRGSIIYGANASGKSNLCSAISFGKEILTSNSFGKLKSELDTFNKNENSTFEYEFVKNDVIYNYGFTLNSKLIIEEWLSISNANITEETVLSINSDGVEKKASFNKNMLEEVADKDKLYLEFINRSREGDKLFISEYLKKREHSFEGTDFDRYLSDVYSWFDEDIFVISPDSQYLGLGEDIIEDPKAKSFYLTFLKAFDTGISNIDEVKINLMDIPERIRETIDNIIESEEHDKNSKFVIKSNLVTYIITLDEDSELKCVSELVFFNKNLKCQKNKFKLSDLSDGTRRLIDIVPALYGAINEKKTFIIDEIDRSLHPLISKLMLEFFYDEDVNPKGQFIITTHDTGLMDQKHLRQDEIWFIQKERDCSSLLYSLEEYKDIRSDKALDKDYLNGRFGGVVNYNTARNMLEGLKNAEAS
ncbi:AAA family ATPase [Vibrio sp. RC27]